MFGFNQFPQKWPFSCRWQMTSFTCSRFYTLTVDFPRQAVDCTVVTLLLPNFGSQPLTLLYIILPLFLTTAKSNASNGSNVSILNCLQISSFLTLKINTSELLIFPLDQNHTPGKNHSTRHKTFPFPRFSVLYVRTKKSDGSSHLAPSQRLL